MSRCKEQRETRTMEGEIPSAAPNAWPLVHLRYRRCCSITCSISAWLQATVGHRQDVDGLQNAATAIVVSRGWPPMLCERLSGVSFQRMIALMYCQFQTLHQNVHKPGAPQHQHSLTTIITQEIQSWCTAVHNHHNHHNHHKTTTVWVLHVREKMRVMRHCGHPSLWTPFIVDTLFVDSMTPHIRLHATLVT